MKGFKATVMRRKDMKIALIATEKLPVPAIRGGAIQIYLEAIAPIIAQKHQVTVFSIQDSKLAQEEVLNGVRYVRVERENYLDGVTKHIGTGNFDVVHVCNRPNWIEPLYKSAPQTKFILSVHNEMFAESKISQMAGEQCISYVTKIVTVSNFIGDTIKKRFPNARNKVETVYSGVDLNAYHPKWTSEGRQIRTMMRGQMDAADKKMALFVGRLSKVKGPHILLQSLPEIIQQHPDTMMVFIGSKWFSDDNVNNYVQYLYRLGTLFPNNVTFIKFVEPADIPKYYSMADVFVCCSQWQEPLARVHYEAMAAGLPVITTNRGGNAEVIQQGKNGYVIDQFEDPAQYAANINKLLGDSSLRERMGKEGRTIVESSFGFSRVANQLQKIYETAL
jgi:spore coat protein SA